MVLLSAEMGIVTAYWSFAGTGAAGCAYDSRYARIYISFQPRHQTAQCDCRFCIKPVKLFNAGDPDAKGSSG